MRLGELAHLDVGSRPARKKFNDDRGDHGGRDGGYEAGDHEDVGPAGDFENHLCDLEVERSAVRDCILIWI